MSGNQKKLITVIAIIMAIFIAITTIVSLFADWLWFIEVCYLFVFKKALFTKWGLGIFFGTFFFLFIYINTIFARKFSPRVKQVFDEPAIERARQFFAKWGRWALLGGSLFISFIAGSTASNQWERLLLYINAQPFNIKDPLFNIDISFFVFKLPFLRFVSEWLFAALIVTIFVVIIIHFLEGSIKIKGKTQRFAPHVKGHISFLISLLFILLAYCPSN